MISSDENDQRRLCGISSKIFLYDFNGRYELLTDYFPWPDNTFDGIMSNWVFVDIGTIEEMNKAVMEIYRVLKPKGPFAMLVNNEEYIGKRTSTGQNGTSGKTYCTVMKTAGFREVTYYVPRLNPRTIEGIDSLQIKGLFPDVDYQSLIDETPSVIIAGNK